jgi:hypothetical protein
MEVAKIRLVLSGGLANKHEIEGYDGFNALASSAFALSLVANYVETGKVRHKGEFLLRHAVHAQPMRPGSLITDLTVPLSSGINPIHGTQGGSPVSLLLGLMSRVIGRNIGIEVSALNPETEAVVGKKGGNVEALVVAAEPSIRRAHDVIGASAETLKWEGGFHSIGQLDVTSKAYMNDTIPDLTLRHKDVSVSGFLANSGRGLVFDRVLGRNISVTMNRDTLSAVSTVFSYGLDQYTNRTGNLIRIGYTSMNSTDGRPKRYVIRDAKVTQMAGTILE